MTNQHDGFPGDRDILILGPAIGSARACIRHRPDHSIETGLAQPLKDGVPIHGEVVQIQPLEEAPGCYEVKDHCSVSRTQPSPKPAKGPAKVSSDQYRNGWERVYGKSNTLN